MVKLEIDVAEIIKKLCDISEEELIEGKVCSDHVHSDHVHMQVTIPPKLSVSEFMSCVKGKSEPMLFDRYPEFRRKNGSRHFWVRGYYDTTVRNVNKVTIVIYIREQEENDKLEK